MKLERMEALYRKKHWDNIYSTKDLNEVSWYQPKPTTSLEFVEKAKLSPQAKIIDVGGGDSLFVDHLLDLGFTNITVLDISAHSIEKAKTRLGERAHLVKWIVADAALFVPSVEYDFWHDRAAFHFLTNTKDITSYLKTIGGSISTDGVLVVGTFSESGPNKCSGIEIKQYSESSLTHQFSDYFDRDQCLNIDHKTPSGVTQNFVFCSFRKKPTGNSI